MEDYYQKEATSLQIIRELKHAHLITPLAAYTSGDLRAFLFPWAEGGNLKEFWKRTTTRATEDGELMKWVLNQLCGICSATKALHEKNCRHTDLKPENILLFEEYGPRGILRIADVGLARFHNDITRQRKSITNAKTGTVRYEPPEMGRDKQLPRVYDVWCLGCVFFEFLIWAVYGPTGLDSFIRLSVEQQFWEKQKDGYHQHWEVRRWITHMSTFLKSGTALKCCLTLIDEGMLVPAWENRLQIADLQIKFEDIRNKAEKDEKFLLDQDLPRRITTPPQSTVVMGSKSITLQVPDQPKMRNSSLASRTAPDVLNDDAEKSTKNLDTSVPERAGATLHVPEISVERAQENVRRF
ncbi:serine/threonine-protein kinase nrc-2 [Colletotrichum spaethianum]|uniref:Serine/threonine-protein kinase nrc-2 n=1 Tax=Colletotrichum spaethianum TaxID=700344 RepID=A0AA37URI3_9PEZI|nr:serine/threonine-protein kinase nrc-2 [Colletotrichum spaethianum]GKT50822.1 serine/threonine-protein kinase nrc-2 [Colletotrichum spaethianum]